MTALSISVLYLSALLFVCDVLPIIVIEAGGTTSRSSSRHNAVMLGGLRW